MLRLDLSTLAVAALAVASSMTAAYWFEALGTDGPPSAPEMIATPVVSSPPGVARVARADDGHYWAEAQINGRAVRVLVDTGASVVSLTRDDALRLGFQLTSEDFDQTVATAGGAARAARVQLAEVGVDGARVARVEALVVERGLAHSLLGMSYLGRLERFEATPESLTLRS